VSVCVCVGGGGGANLASTTSLPVTALVPAQHGTAWHWWGVQLVGESSVDALLVDDVQTRGNPIIARAHARVQKPSYDPLSSPSGHCPFASPRLLFVALQGPAARAAAARDVYTRGFRALRESAPGAKEEAVMLLEAWKAFEAAQAEWRCAVGDGRHPGGWGFAAVACKAGTWDADCVWALGGCAHSTR
jgi:hypothetical protein